MVVTTGRALTVKGHKKAEVLEMFHGLIWVDSSVKVH